MCIMATTTTEIPTNGESRLYVLQPVTHPTNHCVPYILLTINN